MVVKQHKTWHRKIFTYARLIHIYVSTLLFGLLVFFCISGITLNHRWYGSNNHNSFQETPLTDRLYNEWALNQSESWTPNLNRINHYFMDSYRFPPAHNIEIDPSTWEIILDFNVPAGYATAIISEPEKRISLETERGGTLAMINDLHKGRYSGAVWFWLLDVSAALITLFAITGIIILFQGKKNKKIGVFLSVLGILTPVFLFLIFVPNIGV